MNMVVPAKLEMNPAVLVVEGDQPVQRRLQGLLAPAGYFVTCVSTLREAWSAATTLAFQIMIVDRVLPDGDGAALCANVRARCSPGQVFLLMLSTRIGELEVASGRRAGADVYLSKRTSDAELLAYLDAATAAAAFAARSQA